MDLPPSKLSNAASRLWGESTGQFQKKTDVKIDLGLHQTISTNGGSDEKASTSSLSAAGFVFGSRMSERVTNRSNNLFADGSKGSDGKGKPNDVSSIFKRMAEKTTTTVNTATMWKATSSNGSGGITMEKAVSAPFGESVKEFPRKCGETSEGAADSPETEPNKIQTGEENELNLLHISCRFYQYNGEAKTWQERGMGSLKINQNIDVRDDIRIVGRQSGNQRVLINSKIFPEMILEELSEKRLKISARVDESELPQLFLIQASPGSISNLFVMLQKYIDASNLAKSTQQLHLRKRRLENAGEEKAKNGDGESGEEIFEEGKKKLAQEEKKEEDGKEKKSRLDE
ncbi:hypothetical protein niasHS_006825 [Heterodera schachtii]|uniref:RanBD1 domain-containing protein n=1 Tax=Heterodera schachtii TaxID=97005 RepID=A0ABD2JIC7_HETSC